MDWSVSRLVLQNLNPFDIMSQKLIFELYCDFYIKQQRNPLNQEIP